MRILPSEALAFRASAYVEPAKIAGVGTAPSHPPSPSGRVPRIVAAISAFRRRASRLMGISRLGLCVSVPVEHAADAAEDGALFLAAAGLGGQEDPVGEA
jgi:hypothetical protein